MAEHNPLGTVKFWSPNNADYQVWLGSCSTNNVTRPASGWINSKDYALSQPGGQVWTQGTNSMSNLEQTYLHKELFNCGYGYQVALLSDISQLNVKMYLNGKAVDENNNPQPYVVFEGTPSAVLRYYRADNTLIGNVFTLITGGGNASILCGKTLYDDGVFGYNQAAYDEVALRPHYILGVPSTRTYEWNISRHTNPPFGAFQFINASVMDDLWEYLPHEPEGFAETDGEGDFDASSDSIGIPGVPGLSAVSSGLVKMYEMTSTQLEDFKNLLWDTTPGTNFSDTILKLFQDPMEGVINLSICPIEFTGLIAANVIIGNYMFSSVQGQVVTNSYKQIDFGTVYLNEYWGCFSDYSPYTKLSIYLPYAGTYQIHIDDVMNGGINLRANVDVFTGIVQYFLFSAQSNHRGHGHQSVLYTWTGNCKYDIPITGSNYVQAMIKYMGGVLNPTVGMATSIVNGKIGSAIDSAVNTAESLIPNNQVHVQRAGGISGSPGLMGIQYPYLILERPELSMSELYEHTVGIPNDTSDYLSNYSGYVKVKGVHMEISGATSDELNQIESILKAGVII